jgi:hypothetical protein
MVKTTIRKVYKHGMSAINFIQNKANWLFRVHCGVSFGDGFDSALENFRASIITSTQKEVKCHVFSVALTKNTADLELISTTW